MKQKNQKLLAYGLCVIFACTGIAMVGWGWGTWSRADSQTYWHHDGVRAESFREGAKVPSGNGGTLTIYTEAELGLFAYKRIQKHKFLGINSQGICCENALMGFCAWGECQGLDLFDFSNWTIRLGNDLDLSAHLWMPINLFGNMTFDGQNHTIRGVHVEDYFYGHPNIPDLHFCKWCCDLGITIRGFFGYVIENSTVQNLILRNPSIIGLDEGEFIGYISVDSSVINSQVTIGEDDGNVDKDEDEELNNTANITVIIIGSLFIVLVFAFIGFVSVRQMQKRQTKQVQQTA